MSLTLTEWRARKWPDTNEGAALELLFEGPFEMRWGINIHCPSFETAQRICREFDKQLELEKGIRAREGGANLSSPAAGEAVA